MKNEPDFTLDAVVKGMDIKSAGYELDKTVGDFEILYKDKMCLIVYKVDIYDDYQVYLNFEGQYYER